MSRLPGRLLQRLAERLCDPETGRRLLLPIVADLQFEWQQASSASQRLGVRLRGCWAFARALASAAARSSPADRTHLYPLLARIAICTTALSAIQIADQARWLLRRGLAADTIALLVPSVLSSALPTGCFMGILLAGTMRHAGLRLGRRLLVTAVLASLVTFGITGWVTPVANQAYRERVLAALNPGAAQPPARGDRELTFTELGHRAAELRAAGETRGAASADVEWHKKPAMAACCLPLAAAALALSRLVRRRWLRLLPGLGIASLIYLLMRIGEQTADAGRLHPALAMWGPVLVLLVLAVGLAVVKHEGDRATVA